MFGAYIADPNSPESLEKKKAENKEQPLSEQQQETYNKWSETMGDVAENGAATGATQETEPTITEDEPGLQGDALSDMTLPTDDTLQEGTDLPTDDAPAAAEAAPAEDTASAEITADDSAISHFAKNDDEPSGFNPVPVEEQHAAKIAAEAAHAKTYSEPGESTNPVVDEDNIVATEVSKNLGNGDLDAVGEKLEHEGVDIGQEVDALQTDISNDMAEATTAGNPDNKAHDAVVANNIATESGSTAVGAKAGAEDAIEAVKNGEDPMAAIERANALAEQATALASLSEEVSAAAGTTGATETTTAAREMAEEAKDIAEKAKDAAEKAEEEGASEGDGDKEESDDGKTVFSKDDYPELDELQPDPIDGGPITG